MTIGHASVLRGKPLANVVRCVTSHRGTVCHKYPVWRATHAEYAHWTRIQHARKADGTRLLIRTQYPILRRPPPPQPRVLRTMLLYTTYYCLTGWTAGADPPGNHYGIVASYLLPWKAHVRDLTTGWEGIVSDHPDALTQADEWLPCGSAFASGIHVWQVLG